MTYIPPRSQDPTLYAPWPVARPRVPAVVKWAAGAMHAGAVVTAAWGGLLAAASDHPGPGSGWISPPAWWGLVAGFLLGVVGAIPWLWMAWMALAGRGWARILSTVFFSVYFVAFVPGGIISYFRNRSRYPPFPGIVYGVGLELLAGLVAIILLWQPASTWFFRAAKRARAARTLATPALRARP